IASVLQAIGQQRRKGVAVQFLKYRAISNSDYGSAVIGNAPVVRGNGLVGPVDNCYAGPLAGADRVIGRTAERNKPKRYMRPRRRKRAGGSNIVWAQSYRVAMQ